MFEQGALMDTKTSARNNTKDVFISVLAGIGVLIVTFLLGTILIQSIGFFLVDLLIPNCSAASCDPAIIAFSPTGGGLIGIVAGIVAGRKIFKHRKGEGSINISQPTKTNNIHERMNSIYPIIAGAIGGFLIILFIDIVAYWAGNLNDFDLIESLFLDLAILRVFFGGASIFVFILIRALVGGVFGYWAYLLLRRKKSFVVLIGAFLAGSFGGAILLILGIALSVQ